MNDINESCNKCGQQMVVKEGRFGKFLACTGYPDCRNTKQINSDGTPEKPQKTSEKCPECSMPLQMKRGRYGAFFGCTGYPDCRYIKNIENKTGVSCPQCGKGDIIEKKSRQGRTFYSCNKYPECKYALWSKPTGEKCPECESLVVFAAKGIIKCSNRGCKFEKPADNS